MRLCASALTRMRRGAGFGGAAPLNTSSPLSPLSFISSHVFRAQPADLDKSHRCVDKACRPAPANAPKNPIFAEIHFGTIVEQQKAQA